MEKASGEILHKSSGFSKMIRNSANGKQGRKGKGHSQPSKQHVLEVSGFLYVCQYQEELSNGKT